LTYRKDIQILRGLAILFVVLFHLDISAFQSGFLGVDVFFVISGYLMAVIYKNDVLMFYRRRALRILPAYYVAVTVTIVASIIIVKPNEYNQIINQAIYADLFASNIGYWMQNSYFSKREFNPLLHLWSLGVEIQYYLIVPFLFYILRRHIAYFYIILLGSLLLCVQIINISPKTSFFMMPLRVWEFLIGYGVAAYVKDYGYALNEKIRQRISFFCLIIIFSIPLFSVKESFSFVSGHPGLFALIITLASGIIIAFGMTQSFEESFPGTLLEFVGKYSYSIYIIHYPLIVLYSYQPFSGTKLAPKYFFDQTLLILFTAILSYGMYHYVEKKFRSYQKINKILYASPFIVLAVTLSGCYIHKYIYSEKEKLIFNAFYDTGSYRCGKLFRFLNPTSIICEITDSDMERRQNVLLVGNSHADTIKTTFANTACHHDTGLLFLVPNDPLMKNSRISATSLINEATMHKVDTIVLHFSHGGIDAVGFSKFNKLVDLAYKNHIYVAFIMPVPIWEEHIPKALWNNFKHNKPLQIKNKFDYREETGTIRNALLKILSDNFRLYEVYHYFCSNNCEIIDKKGSPLYYDSHHLTLTGSQKLSCLFEIIIKDGYLYKKSKL